MKKILLTIFLLGLSLPASATDTELTCFDQGVITHHYILGTIDPTTGFRVKALRMAYVLLQNPENEDETRELFWRVSWKCLFEKHSK